MKNLFNRLLGSLGQFIAGLLNVGIRMKCVVALLILAVGGTAALTYTNMMNNVGGKEDYEEAMRYVEVKKIINEKFISDVDDTTMTDASSAAIVAGLGDKWSSYMTKDEYKTYQLYNSNEYSDIGMSIMKNEGGGFNVISVTPSTPAANAGLAAGMIITDIDGYDVTNSDIDEVRQLIRAKLNDKFTLGINGGKTKLEVNCSAFYFSSVLSRYEKTEAGYIQITNFEAGTGTDAVNAMEDLVYNKKCVALCIDLRSNPGGLASEAATVLDYLLPSGVLFSLVDKNGHKEVTESDILSLSLPMVVIVDSNTYAEAEVFAAVMREYGAAVIMGEATPGMTRIQETFELEDGSALRISTKSYVTSKGVDIASEGGVIPDQIIHNSDPSTAGTTEGTTDSDSNGAGVIVEDEQLIAALKYLS